jgi:hypothetical protein
MAANTSRVHTVFHVVTTLTDAVHSDRVPSARTVEPTVASNVGFLEKGFVTRGLLCRTFVFC